MVLGIVLLVDQRTGMLPFPEQNRTDLEKRLILGQPILEEGCEMGSLSGEDNATQHMTNPLSKCLMLK